MFFFQTKKRLFTLFGLRLVESPDASNKSYVLHTIYNLREIGLDDDDELNSLLLAESNDIIDQDETPNDNSDDSIDDDVDDDIWDTFPDDIAFDHVVENSKRSLLLISLSLIFMNEFPMPEKDLFNSLKDLGLNLEKKIETSHG